MGIKALLSKPLASYIVGRQKKWMTRPDHTQDAVLKYLIKEGSQTLFGRDHQFDAIRSPDDFKKSLPIRDYEDFSDYMTKVLAGEKDILWKGKPLYLAKTSGTTSGIKYIPVSKESIPYHINGARDALLNYIHRTGKSQFLDGNLMFLSGSPVLENDNGIHIGRLSGIVNHHVPAYLRSSQLPRYETNIIEDWEKKLDSIIDETLYRPMSLISGIPPWIQMYFDKLYLKTGKKIKDIFPYFSLLVYGGVNFEPYKRKLFDSVGKQVDAIETYPASEGFIAFQDTPEEGLLLLLNSGIYYEFIPADDYFKKNPTRLCLGEVKTGVNYALVMSTNAGLWAYSLGDTIKFISTDPYRIIVTGRIKHFISAFGEHVIGEEIEKAMTQTLKSFKEVGIIEFTVAPQVTPESGLPYHEWFVEFSSPPSDMAFFQATLDSALVKLNTYYRDLIVGNILRKLKISPLKKDSFRQYMATLGKLGGQNKMPRLSNDRKIAGELQKYKIESYVGDHAQ